MKSFIIANWKMNPKTLAGAKKLFSSAEKGIRNVRGVETIICPPFVYLSEFKASKVKLGAQNCFWEDSGAYTGEISAKMIRGLGCKYVIIGHSERRRYFKEANLVINRKVKSALQNKLKVILCIGETAKEKNKGEFSKVIRDQIEKGLKGVPKVKTNEIIIAYEPVWAIGTGKACKPVQAQVTSLLIRKILTKLYSRDIAEKVPVLYGGSVNKDNASGYLKNSSMRGLLIGGASLRPKEFIRIVKDASKL